MLSSGKVLRIPRLDGFERQDALPQIAVDRRIIAPVDQLRQTVGWKLVYGEIVHGQSFRSKQPENTDDRNKGAPYTTGSMAYCPSIPLGDESRTWVLRTRQDSLGGVSGVYP